jgi:hypothetical protein
MPRTYLDTRYVAPTGKTINVPAGGDLQAAINNAARGDVIQLAAGARFVGNFYLPAKAGSGWITIRTATTLPAEGTRVTPSMASSFAKLITPNSVPALFTRTSGSASYYRVMGVEITSSASMTYALVNLGDYSRTAGAITDYSQHIILDRTYIHGTSTMNLQRCISLNNRSSAVIDSWISECHYRYVDSQAIASWDGPGPFKIVNNHLEGASENVLFGGGDPRFTGVTPSDIEFRFNHVVKPLGWNSSGIWSVKNLFEIKNAQRVLVEKNIFENNWREGQDGFAIVLKSANQGGRCNWCVAQDLTIRSNLITNTPGAFNIMDVQALNGGSAIPANDILIENNVFQNVAQSNLDGKRILFQLLGAIRDVQIVHNTGFTDDKIILFDGAPTTGLVIRDNLFSRGTYGVFGGNVGEGTRALAAYAPDGFFRGNAIIAAPGSQYPSGNSYPLSISSVGMIDYSGDNFTLSTSSPYYGSGTAGSMPGANLGALSTAFSTIR